jgi:drug/metabolite transporter (DMT)-like permease
LVAVIYGVLGFGIAYALLYYALVGLSAGTTSVIMASVPLFTLVLAVVHGQERFSIRGVVGGLLAIAGIGLLSTGSLGGEVRPIYFIAGLLAVAAVAESSVVIKGLPKADPVATNAVGMGVGTIFLVVFSLVLREPWVLPQEGQTWLALAWLVVAGSVGLFILYLYVMSHWTASATNYAVTLMPVVAVTLGALFADEVVSLQLIGGGALVVLAVYVGALSQSRQPGAAVEVPEPVS